MGDNWGENIQCHLRQEKSCSLKNIAPVCSFVFKRVIEMKKETARRSDGQTNIFITVGAKNLSFTGGCLTHSACYLYAGLDWKLGVLSG